MPSVHTRSIDTVSVHFSPKPSSSSCFLLFLVSFFRLVITSCKYVLSFIFLSWDRPCAPVSALPYNLSNSTVIFFASSSAFMLPEVSGLKSCIADSFFLVLSKLLYTGTAASKPTAHFPFSSVSVILPATGTAPFKAASNCKGSFCFLLTDSLLSINAILHPSFVFNHDTITENYIFLHLEYIMGFFCPNWLNITCLSCFIYIIYYLFCIAYINIAKNFN